MDAFDFLLRSRQLFGFLVPGVMWISIVSLFISGCTPLTWIENGQHYVLRSIVVLSVAYICGFAIQTLLWSLIVNPIKHRIESSNGKYNIHHLANAIDSTLPPSFAGVFTQGSERRPIFFKWYVLEYSKELRKTILEKEADINFLVAVIIPAPLLFVSWTWFTTSSVLIAIAAGVLAVLLAAFLYGSLKRYLEREIEEWYESFLVMQMTQKEKEVKNFATASGSQPT